MAKPLLPDELWERIQPLLPPRPKPKRSDRPGRPPTRGSQGVDRHPVRPQDRHRLGGPAPGDRLWLWHDLLASSATGTKPASGRNSTRCCSPNSTAPARSTGGVP